MWKITSIETEQVDEIDFVSEEAQAKADLLEICTGLFDEISEDFDWQGFSVHLITEGSVDQICDQIGQNSTAGAEMREEENAPIGFVRHETKEVFFFPHIAVEILWELGTLNYAAIEEFVRAYVKHEHRHVLQLRAFERAGLDLEQVWQKVLFERNTYGYLGVMLEQDAFAVQFDCCEWDLQEIVSYYAEA